jgi:hypothetical protein
MKYRIEIEVGPRLATFANSYLDAQINFGRRAWEWLDLFTAPLLAAMKREIGLDEHAPPNIEERCISPKANGICGKELAPGCHLYCRDCVIGATQTEIDMHNQSTSKENES